MLRSLRVQDHGIILRMDQPPAKGELSLLSIQRHHVVECDLVEPCKATQR